MSVFRVIGDTKIPVSKHLGAVWKERKRQCHRIREERGLISQWKKALELYTSLGVCDELAFDERETATQHENVVLSTITAQVASALSGEAACTISANGGSDQGFDQVLRLMERAINTLISEPAPNGLALSSKVRRAFVIALCTNNAFAAVDYISKDDGSEAALEDLMRLSKELEEAEDGEEIARVEGELLALEQQVSLLSPSGLKVRILSPMSVYVDPASENADLSDARWVMVAEHISTELLRAQYFEKHGEEYRSIFAPTVLANDVRAADDFSYGKDYAKFGYESEEEFRRNATTKVWFVWDKATRRIYMFNDVNWNWPIWVYDDPYRLPRFFNIVRLSPIISADGKETCGEVSYYRPQQESINLINQQIAQARADLATKLFFAKNRGITEDDINALLNSNDGRCMGIDVPEGMTIKDMIEQLVPNVSRHPELFSIDRCLDSINRIAGIPSVLRGEQFKTNTTNDAVSAYSSVAQLHTDFKVSAIEDFISSIADIALFIMMTQFTPEEVAMVVGPETATQFQAMTPQDARLLGMKVKIVGGTTMKPTSKARQQQALEIAGVLGQFGRAAPGVLLIVLKVLARAFEGAIVKQEDWTEAQQMLMQTLMAPQQPQGMTPNAQG